MTKSGRWWWWPADWTASEWRCSSAGWGFLVRCSLSLFDERQVGCEIKQIDLFLSSLGISHLTTIQSSGWRREDSDDDDDGQSFSPANSSWISSLMEIPFEEKFNFSWICRRFCFSSKKTDKWRWMSPMKWRRRRMRRTRCQMAPVPLIANRFCFIESPELNKVKKGRRRLRRTSHIVSYFPSLNQFLCPPLSCLVLF